MIATLILPTDRFLLLPDLRAVRRTPLPCISRPKDLLCLRLRPGYSGAHRCSAIGKSIICLPLRRYLVSGMRTRPRTEWVARGLAPCAARNGGRWPPEEATPTLVFACRNGILRVSEPEDQTAVGLRWLGSSPCRCGTSSYRTRDMSPVWLAGRSSA